jgi:hypothetical protein
MIYGACPFHLESLTGTLPDAISSTLSAVLTLTELLSAAAVSSFPPMTKPQEIEEAQTSPITRKWI